MCKGQAAIFGGQFGLLVHEVGRFPWSVAGEEEAASMLNRSSVLHVWDRASGHLVKKDPYEIMKESHVGFQTPWHVIIIILAVISMLFGSIIYFRYSVMGVRGYELIPELIRNPSSIRGTRRSSEYEVVRNNVDFDARETYTAA